MNLRKKGTTKIKIRVPGRGYEAVLKKDGKVIDKAKGRALRNKLV